MSMIDSYELDELREKAAILDFLLVAGTSDALGDWVEFVADSMKSPETPAEALDYFTRLYQSAKAAGVYPVKTS